MHMTRGEPGEHTSSLTSDGYLEDQSPVAPVFLRATVKYHQSLTKHPYGD